MVISKFTKLKVVFSNARIPVDLQIEPNNRATIKLGLEAAPVVCRTNIDTYRLEIDDLVVIADEIVFAKKDIK